MQELTKSQNQDLRADAAWSMNIGKMEDGSGGRTPGMIWSLQATGY